MTNRTSKHQWLLFCGEKREQSDTGFEQTGVVQYKLVKYACAFFDLGIKVTQALARIIPRGLLTETAMA
ncbi:transposase IS66 [Burkholderia aenigmatica]|uniref:Transposase IS66 n=1 Tax=Burkholderia aenigmatica TaxID=2015348 RepID=A0A6P2HZN3_9BURK|nr:hypothetical protein [Burkholderia aenigmatica]VWB23706.1 transposase IS66 [Burkholderia aenigmatica]